MTDSTYLEQKIKKIKLVQFFASRKRKDQRALKSNFKKNEKNGNQIVKFCSKNYLLFIEKSLEFSHKNRQNLQKSSHFSTKCVKFLTKHY